MKTKPKDNVIQFAVRPADIKLIANPNAQKPILEIGRAFLYDPTTGEEQEITDVFDTYYRKL